MPLSAYRTVAGLFVYSKVAKAPLKTMERYVAPRMI